MSKFEKYVTMIVALIGAITGGWAVYTDYDKSEFLKPISLREATVESFKSQIESATERKDNNEAKRVRLNYEKYEESWRASQQFATITAPINELISLKVSQQEIDKLKSLLTDTNLSIDKGFTEPEMLASAFLVTGDYSNASKYYQLASYNNPDNANFLALQSITFTRLAESESDPDEKARYLQQSDQFSKHARKDGIDASKIQVLLNELKTNN